MLPYILKKKKIFADATKLKVLCWGDYPGIIGIEVGLKHNLMCHCERKTQRDFCAQTHRQCEDKAEREI